MQFTTSDGLRLFYLDEGEGDPVLCLPGLTRHTGDFNDLAAWLTDVRLIRMSFRGRKGSDYDPNFMNYNVMREAQDVIELLDHLGLKKVTIIGTSRGGLVSMVLGMTAPQRLAGVVLNDIGPELAAEGLTRIMGYVGVPPVFRTYDEAILGLKAFMGNEFPTLTDEKLLQCAKLWFDEDINGLALNYDEKIRDAMIDQAKAGPVDLWPLLDSLRHIPTGLIRGANTDLLTLEAVEKMKARNPEMLVTNVPDRGHVPFLDEPESKALIREILRQVSYD